MVAVLSFLGRNLKPVNATWLIFALSCAALRVL